MRKNLFSVANAVDAGHSVLFEPNGVKFFRNITKVEGDVVHTGKRVRERNPRKSEKSKPFSLSTFRLIGGGHCGWNQLRSPVRFGAMEQYGRSSEGSRSDPSAEWAGPEEGMWQLGLGAAEESYPQRPDEADCTYYLRTGFCGFGSRCRFNHPPDRAAVVGADRAAGDYPERVGQPLCQYYMRTRTCKFGSSCKYHHPRQAGAAATPVSLNYYGYPLRPGKKECSYYVKMGQCKFGATCKFHHPVPAGVQSPAPSPVAPISPLPVPLPSPLYSTMQPPPGPSSQQIGVLVARPPMLPGSLV